MTDVIDGTATDIGTELTPAPQPGTGTLFRTDDPLEVVDKASKVADVLKQVLQRQGLTSKISGREHVRVEGWTTLGSMLGVVPVVAWTRHVENGWEARVEARTLDGRVIGAAEAQCTRDESMWAKRDDYALRSMAQTRATSKALRGPLGFVVTLAGFEATPDEEMPREDTGYGRPPYGPPADDGQLKAASWALALLCGGDEDVARAQWGELKKQFGYMPAAVALALPLVGHRDDEAAA